MNDSNFIGYSLYGMRVKAHRIGVERRSLPGLSIDGLKEAQTKECQVRVRCALQSVESLQGGVNLTVVEGSTATGADGMDLALALAVLGRDLPAFGALALDGRVQPVRGALLITEAMKGRGHTHAFVPVENAAEAALSGLTIYPVGHLRDLLRPVEKHVAYVAPSTTHQDFAADLADVRGQALGRRALEVAAAGGHHLLLTGPVGAGKTMLARRLPGILPAMTHDEALEVTRVASISGINIGGGLVKRRPFRAPHHSTSAAGLVGGGGQPRPGELTLAHHGVLFLDDLPEFQRQAIEMLREPMASGEVVLMRAAGTLEYPARAIVVGSMSPCPCGMPPRCRCSAETIQRHKERSSVFPFDVRVTLQNVDLNDLTEARAGESSALVAERVLLARGRQQQRQEGVNADLDADNIENFAPTTDAAAQLLRRRGLAKEQALAVHRVARTIADLDESDLLDDHHVAEALQFIA